MNLSIFDNDGTLGQSGGTRSVVFRVQGYNTTLFSFSATDQANIIRRALTENLIGVEYVAYVDSSLINSWFDFRVSIDALNSHSVDTVKRLVVNALSPVLRDLKVTFEGEGSNAVGGVDRSGDNGSSFADQLGLGLGISTPIVIGAGVILAILLLKR